MSLQVVFLKKPTHWSDFQQLPTVKHYLVNYTERTTESCVDTVFVVNAIHCIVEKLPPSPLTYLSTMYAVTTFNAPFPLLFWLVHSYHKFALKNLSTCLVFVFVHVCPVFLLLNYLMVLTEAACGN